MNSWFDIRSLGSKVDFDESQVLQSTKRVLSVLEQEVDKLDDKDYSKVFLGGFSQGCCMAISTALHAPKTIGGVIGLSGAAFPFLIEKVIKEN
jgi:predicted esterase